MLYVLDMFHKPPLVVVATDDGKDARAVAQKYADQTGRRILIAEGDAPGRAPFAPTIPE